MQRRNFLSASALGISLLSLPGVSYAQKIKGEGNSQQFNIPPREALKPGAGNADIRTIIRADMTSSQISNVEVSIAPKQMGPSPHMHENLDELMYVLEGTATVMIGETIYVVEAGGWNFRPRKVVHAFWNASDKPLRFIDNFFNQNFEDYLEELFHKILPDMIKNKQTPASPEIADKMAALDKRFGVTWFHDQRQAIIDKYDLQS